MASPANFFLLLVTAMLLSKLSLATSKVLVIMGDSLTDQGNIFRASNFTIPRPRYYWQGRYTGNGGNWVDELRRIAGRNLSVSNFAYGGGAACTAYSGMSPSLGQQVSMYIAKLATDPVYRSQLRNRPRQVLIWSGHNDLVALTQMPPSAAPAVLSGIVECIMNSTMSLLRSGEQNVGIMSLAPLDLTPLIRAMPGFPPLVKSAMDGINGALRMAAAQLSMIYRPQSVTFLDVNAIIANTVLNFTSFGYRSNAACLVYAANQGVGLGSVPLSECQRPNNFVFYDHLHPSPKAHKALGQGIHAMLSRFFRA
ncbi:hypothetical protein V8C86DRAFT_2477458 [Haematococcus lacustris]